MILRLVTKTLSLFLIIFLSLTFLLPATAFDNVIFGMSNQRDRVSRDTLTRFVTKAWETKVTSWENQNPAVFAQPIVLEGENRIYTLMGQELVSMNLKTGQVLQRRQVESAEYPSGSSITYSGGKIYFGTRKGDVLAFDQNLSPLWHYQRPTQKVTSSPLVINNMVIIGSNDAFLYPLNTSNGQPQFGPLNLKGAVTSSPALIQDRIYIGVDKETTVGYVVALNLSGRKVWEYQTRAGIPASIATDGERVYFSDKKGRFYALNKTDGTCVWAPKWTEGGKKIRINNQFCNLSGNNSQDSFINNSPVVCNDNVYFALRSNKGGPGRIVALNKYTGQVLWSKALIGNTGTSPVYWQKAHILLAADLTGRIYGLNPDTGQEVNWYYNRSFQPAKLESVVNIGKPITGELALGGQHILISTRDGAILALSNGGLTDLEATSLTTNTTAVQSGQTYQGTARVTNNSNFSLSTKVIIQKDGLTILTRDITIPGLPPISDRTAPPNYLDLPFSWAAPSPQPQVNLRITLNPDQKAYNTLSKEPVAEVTYLNNTRAINIPWEGIDLSAYNLTGPNQVQAGRSYTSRVTLSNRSNSTFISPLRLYLNNREIKNQGQLVTLAAKARKTISFTWTSPAVQGQVTLKAIINPDRNRPPNEPNWSNNVAIKTLNVMNQPEESGGQLTISASPNPTQTKAGYGFTITANTQTQPYVWTETETRTDSKGNIYTVTVTKSRPCPGARRVRAYFPNGQVVDLVPAKSTSSPTNTWTLPPNPNSKNHLRRHYIPKDTPDGDYLVKLVASGAGDNRNLTAVTTIKVRVKGSMYDDVSTVITK